MEISMFREHWFILADAPRCQRSCLLFPLLLCPDPHWSFVHCTDMCHLWHRGESNLCEGRWKRKAKETWVKRCLSPMRYYSLFSDKQSLLQLAHEQNKGSSWGRSRGWADWFQTQNVSHIFALKINTEENVQSQKPHATNVKDFKKYLATYAVIDSGPP